MNGPGASEESLVAVSIACESEAAAGQLAAALVEQRLVACAQSWPMRSTYRWQGTIEGAAEHMLTAKTTAALLPDVEALVRSLHSYEVPEIVAQALSWASEPYAQWVRESVRTAGAPVGATTPDEDETPL
ncbi:MAG TPA: divalent-cation tolerance protein CutA [Devosiaceae bacterium]|nr:divalent-cation tolerance protein CutA [Devosiaceae bacterium]